MKPDKCFNKFNITKNIFILLIVAISLLMLNSKAFPADTNGLYLSTIVNDKVNDTLTEPLKRLKNAIDLINLKYQDAPSNEVEAQVSRAGFEWIFEADGIALVRPVINPEDGAVLVATTDLDIDIELINFNNDESVIRTGNLQSKLYALKPNPISKRGGKDWDSDIDGIIIFPPVSSNDDAFVMSLDGDVDFDNLEGLEGLNDLEGFLENLEDLAGIGNNVLNDIVVKLTAVDNNGRKKWDAPVEFTRTLPTGLPVAAPGLILATTIKIPDSSDMSFDISDIIKDFTGVVSAFNSDTGEEEWTFNPAEIDSESKLFVFNIPTVNDNTIFVNAISFISEKEINDFIDLIETTIADIQSTVQTTITNSLSELLSIILVGGDIQPVVDNITEEIELLINDSINNITNGLPDLSSRLFALDSGGEIMWDTEFTGISVTSPVVTDSGINVNSTNISLGDVSFDAEVVAALTPEGILNIDATINLLIAGTSINVGMVLTLDITSAVPLDTLTTEFDIPDISEVLGSLNILEGVSTTFNETDGELKWQTMIGEPILFKPVASGNQITVATSGFNTDNATGDIVDILELILTNPVTKVYSLDTSNGGINWTSDRIDGTIVSSVLLGPDNGVFLTFIDNGDLQIHALDPNDGSAKWANPFKPVDFVTSTPIINPNDGMVFLSTSKLEDVLDFGASKGRIKQGRTKIRDLIPDLNGEIIGLNPSTGAIDKTIEVEGFPLVSPAIDEDTLYSATSDFKARLSGSVNLLTFVNASDLK